MATATTARPRIREVRNLDTAEQLLEELTPPSGTLWTRPGLWTRPEHETDWLFRGQSNGKDGTIYPLLPSSFRKGAFLPLIPGQVTMPELTASDQRNHEIHAVMRFADLVDKHGFIVPGDDPELRDRRISNPVASADYKLFPHPRLAAMTALAQHHGIPTRLLDWTWKPLIAAFFAASGVARRRPAGVKPPDAEAPFSVFALRRHTADATSKLDQSIYVITVPTATNSRLHAQGGQFTLVQPRDTDVHPLPTIEAVLDTHEDAIFGSNPQWYERAFPLLIEYRVPAREARTMMMLLAVAGVTAASAFPSLEGVATAMFDDQYHQFARPGSRS